MYRECLFARYRLLIATGLSETASRLGVGLSVGSVHIVFQHPVYLLTPFVVDSAVVAFDARAIYIEQRIARLRDEGDKNECVRVGGGEDLICHFTDRCAQSAN